jgi:hypothetical protein
MEYLIFGTILIILVLLVIHNSNRRNSKKKIEQIRAAWGNPKANSFYFNGIRTYADIVQENCFHKLTEQTIDDIDFFGLFAFIDRTTSKVGQQFLFKKMIEPTNNVVNQSEELVQLFTKDERLRETVQLELLKLENNDAYHLSSLLRRELIQKPKWFNFLILDIVVVLCVLLLSLKFPVLIVVLIILLTLNMVLHYWNKSNTFEFIRSFNQLNILINVSGTLLKKSELLHSEGVEKSISNLKSFQRKIRLIYTDSGNGIQAELSLIGTYIIELVKAFLLLELFTLFNVLKDLENKKSSIVTLFNYVGNIDASISIASLRAGSLTTCQPVFTSEKKEVVTKNVYHPLITNCVKNSIAINDKSVLITGSNMSGKSTFLRTLTINSILAQTIYTCFADEYSSPILKQFSSIRIDDNLFEGKSYYFQEVNIMASLLKEADFPQQNLFVLDEVFKGTNTVERIAAAKAILSYLNRKGNIVLVSTHDIELADMLKDEYDLYHFTETIEDDGLHFDHTIKHGQVRTRNAIKILELANYPADIIREARQISTTLTTAKVY